MKIDATLDRDFAVDGPDGEEVSRILGLPLRQAARKLTVAALGWYEEQVPEECSDVTLVGGHVVAENHVTIRRLAYEDAVRAATLDAYEERPPIAVKQVLLTKNGCYYHEQFEPVTEVAGMYLWEHGEMLGDTSDSRWATWVVGSSCLAVVADGDEVQVTPGSEVADGDKLLGMMCPRCGDAIDEDTMLDVDDVYVLRCRRCGLTVETGSIPAHYDGRRMRTADIPLDCLPDTRCRRL